MNLGPSVAGCDHSFTISPLGLMANKWGESKLGFCGVALKYAIATWLESNRTGVVILVSATYLATVAWVSGGEMTMERTPSLEPYFCLAASSLMESSLHLGQLVSVKASSSQLPR